MDIFIVSESLERLEKFNLIETKQGRFVPTGANLAVESAVASREMREFHLQMMEKAMQIVDTGDKNERDVSHIIFAMDEKDYPRAQEALKKIRREFATSLQENSQKNSLYSLGLQLIPITHNKKESV